MDSSGMFNIFCFFLAFINAGILAVIVARSKENSNEIIKKVLIGTGICVILTFLIQFFVICIGFMVVFAVIGHKRGNTLNLGGIISLLVYWLALYKLRVIDVGNGLQETGIVPSTQMEITVWLQKVANRFSFEDSELFFTQAKLRIVFGVMIFLSVLFFEMILLRNSKAQMYMAGALAAASAGLWYLDYSITHPEGFLANLGKSVAEFLTGCTINWGWIAVLAILSLVPLFFSYTCTIKDDKK